MKRILLSLVFTAFVSAFSFGQSEVTFYTNQGNFVLTLDDSIMPITAGNFKSLVDTGFYDGVIFHRIISTFMIQGGDPTGTGSGGPGYNIQDEFVTGQSNIKKTISMANIGQPNSGGSQFFINVKDNTFLDFDKSPFTSKHPVFGIVTSGWSVVETIKNVPTNTSDRPITPVVMDSLRTTGSVLSLEEINANKTLTKIYPNPVTSQSVLDVYVADNRTIKINVFNQRGRLLFSESRNMTVGKTLIPLSDFGVLKLQSGTYFISIENGANTMTEKIIISK